jgi:hypothetical protein
MKVQKYKNTNDKIWKDKYKGEPFKYEKKSLRYNHKYLKSGYYENQVWGALHKAWLGYIIADNKWEFNKRIEYAKRIRNLKTIRTGVVRF